MTDFWKRDIPASASGYPICRRCGKEIKTPMMVVIDEFQAAYCTDCIEEMKGFNLAAKVE